MDRKFIPCAKMFLLMLGRDPIEGLFFTKDLKIQFGPPAHYVEAARREKPLSRINRDR
jgi:hypothetical protein